MKTSTTKPSADRFTEHLKQCPQCKECCAKWWDIKDITYQEAREKFDLCADARKILRAIFN